MSQSDHFPLSVAVVEAIAAADGVEPTELGYSLYEYVETDVIDALYEQTDTNWRLEFRASEHTVTVDSDGTILVDGTVHDG